MSRKLHKVSPEYTVHVFLNAMLDAAVQAVANERFEGNRSAAIRWMLTQSLTTPDVQRIYQPDTSAPTA